MPISNISFQSEQNALVLDISNGTIYCRIFHPQPLKGSNASSIVSA